MMIHDAVQGYISKGIYPFHMPGHKRNAGFAPGGLLGMDLTEVPGLDNLHNASGAIRASQEAAAEIYGADNCFFSVGGASAGVAAAICAACGDGALLMARNSHISAYDGVVFSGAKPVYVYPDETPYGLCGGVNPIYIKHMLETHPECRAVLIVSPTYEGFVSDIKSIAEATRACGKILIVDEAHGAHFPFHASFPGPSIRLGADIAITSPHKTLPALTQGALVLTKGGNADIERLTFFMRACQTSSPSYIIMSAMDYALRGLSRNGAAFDAFARRLAEARTALGQLGAFGLVGAEIVGQASIHGIDLSKMLFVSRGGATGAELEKRLADEHKAQLEMSGENFALALTSVADTDNGFERLINGVKAIDAQSKGLSGLRQNPAPVAGGINRGAQTPCVTPRQAVFSPWAHVAPQDGVGKISAGFVCQYPPGVPVLAPGDYISADISEKLSGMGIKYIKTLKDS